MFQISSNCEYLVANLAYCTASGQLIVWYRMNGMTSVTKTTGSRIILLDKVDSSLTLVNEDTLIFFKCN